MAHQVGLLLLRVTPVFLKHLWRQSRRRLAHRQYKVDSVHSKAVQRSMLLLKHLKKLNLLALAG